MEQIPLNICSNTHLVFLSLFTGIGMLYKINENLKYHLRNRFHFQVHFQVQVTLALWLIITTIGYEYIFSQVFIGYGELSGKMLLVRIIEIIIIMGSM